MQILIAEDDAVSNKLLQRILTDQGHHVFSFCDGQAALDHFSREPTQVIISDWMMPVMDGRTFLNIVQKDDEFKDIPVLVISATATSAQAMGAKAFIPKPIDFHHLMEKINEFCR